MQSLLHHSKSATCVISKLLMCLLCRSCTPKQIDFKYFLSLQLPYCAGVLLLTSRCKLQHLAPPQSILTTQIQTKLMLCKSLFIIHRRVKAFLKLYWSTKTKHLSSKNGHGTCITRLHKREVSSLSTNK